MSTNVHTNGTESSLSKKFYVPAAAAEGGESYIERFVTALYDRHSLLTRRLE